MEQASLTLQCSCSALRPHSDFLPHFVRSLENVKGRLPAQTPLRKLQYGIEEEIRPYKTWTATQTLLYFVALWTWLMLQWCVCVYEEVPTKTQHTDFYWFAFRCHWKCQWYYVHLTFCKYGTTRQLKKSEHDRLFLLKAETWLKSTNSSWYYTSDAIHSQQLINCALKNKLHQPLYLLTGFKMVRFTKITNIFSRLFLVASIIAHSCAGLAQVMRYTWYLRDFCCPNIYI